MALFWVIWNVAPLVLVLVLLWLVLTKSWLGRAIRAAAA